MKIKLPKVKLRSRQKVLLVSGAVVVLVLVIGSGLVFFRQESEEPIPTAADAQIMNEFSSHMANQEIDESAFQDREQLALAYAVQAHNLLAVDKQLEAKEFLEKAESITNGSNVETLDMLFTGYASLQDEVKKRALAEKLSELVISKAAFEVQLQYYVIFNSAELKNLAEKHLQKAREMNSTETEKFINTPNKDEDVAS